MNLSIIASSGKLFTGKADSVILPGTLGSFQVLPNHAPTLSSLMAGKITYTAGATSSSIAVKGGFTSIAHNKIMVVCEPAE